VRDPRALLAAYDAAVASAGGSPPTKADAELAARVAKLGE